MIQQLITFFKKLCWVYQETRHPRSDELMRIEEENKVLRDYVAGKVAEDVLVKQLLTTDRGLYIEFEGGAMHLFAEMLAKQMKDIGAENYIEMSFTSKDIAPGESFVLTLQRVAGKTPHQKVIEMQKKLDEYISNSNW